MDKKLKYIYEYRFDFYEYLEKINVNKLFLNEYLNYINLDCNTFKYYIKENLPFFFNSGIKGQLFFADTEDCLYVEQFDNHNIMVFKDKLVFLTEDLTLSKEVKGNRVSEYFSIQGNNYCIIRNGLFYSILSFGEQFRNIDFDNNIEVLTKTLDDFISLGDKPVRFIPILFNKTTLGFYNMNTARTELYSNIILSKRTYLESFDYYNTEIFVCYITDGKYTAETYIVNNNSKEILYHANSFAEITVSPHNIIVDTVDYGKIKADKNVETLILEI